MCRYTAIVVACVMAWGGLALAAEGPRVEAVQGLYEGVRQDDAKHKLEARVVATGRGTYKLLIREAADDGKTEKVELAGKTQDDAISFSGKKGEVAWTGTWAEGTVKGLCGASGMFELKRIVKESPTLGAKPPQGATVLLDGKNFDEMTLRPLPGGAEQEWKKTEEGAIQVPRGGMNSKRTFAGNVKIHVEFKLPLMPEASDQGRANSGVYLPNGEEIQVLDSFGMTTYQGGGCGGLYRWKDPDVFDQFSLASLPPLQWQTYDIEYRVTMQDGKPTGKPHVTVWHNGIKIHDNVELRNNARAGVFNFQDHGNAVQYRNIWVAPLDGK